MPDEACLVLGTRRVLPPNSLPTHEWISTVPMTSPRLQNMNWHRDRPFPAVTIVIRPGWFRTAMGYKYFT